MTVTVHLLLYLCNSGVRSSDNFQNNHECRFQLYYVNLCSTYICIYLYVVINIKSMIIIICKHVCLLQRFSSYLLHDDQMFHTPALSVISTSFLV